MTIPDTRRKKRLSRGAYAAIVAISLHLAGLIVWSNRGAGTHKIAPARVIPIANETARAALESSRRARQENEQRVKQKAPITETKPVGPVVELDQAKARPQTPARFSAEQDASADHETRARVRALTFTPKHPLEPTPPMSKKEATTITGSRDAPAPSPAAKAERNRGASPSGKKRLAFDSTVKVRPQSAEALARTPLGLAQDTFESSKEPTSPERRGLSLDDLIPDRQKLAGLAGGAAPDVLGDMDVGDETRLNAQQFRYAGFFNRVKRSVSSHWRAMEEHNRRDPSGRLYGVASRQTVLAVVLNESGMLTETRVSQSSGIDFLDAAAVRAFREGQPFSNPPRALLDQNKEIRFDFLFQLTFEGRYSY